VLRCFFFKGTVYVFVEVHIIYFKNNCFGIVLEFVVKNYITHDALQRVTGSKSHQKSSAGNALSHALETPE